MLKRGCKVNVFDSSGVTSIKILSIKKKKNWNKSFATVSDIIFGIVYDINLKKKKRLLSRKSKVAALIVGVSKKFNKQNSMFIRFSENRCIPLKITKFINPLAPKNFSFVFYEVKSIKKFKIITDKSARLLL